MEITVFYSLLLLVCSLSGVILTPVQEQTAEQHSLQNEVNAELIPHLRKRREAEPAPQQLNPSDLHAELREMKTSLAEQKVEIKCLQTQTEAQADRLRELERQTTEVDDLKGKLEVHKAELTTLRSELATLKARTNTTETHVVALKRDKEVIQVAFSASLLDSGSGYFGPFQLSTTVIYTYVVTNIGNAYNSHTGLFTAPVRGAYHFEWYVGAYSSYPSGAVLVKNEQQIFTAYQQYSYYGTSANGATLLLEVGDVVFLLLQPDTRMYDSHTRRNTFSGYLLFTISEGEQT
ncbi:hypothetical protein LDENG_00231500 [Lucifuga dentata]|nr:hypothetical protein LDENG_00231500 [Lucifuga dentata]